MPKRQGFSKAQDILKVKVRMSRVYIRLKMHAYLISWCYEGALRVHIPYTTYNKTSL